MARPTKEPGGGERESEGSLVRALLSAMVEAGDSPSPSLRFESPELLRPGTVGSCPGAWWKAKSVRLEHSGQWLVGVHESASCEGRSCSLHRRTDHHMREFPQEWDRYAKRVMRKCPHELEHPDPDDNGYFLSLGAEVLLEKSRHKCDGCCIPPDKRKA